jgi:hypothetical protein
MAVPAASSTATGAPPVLAEVVRSGLVGAGPAPRRLVVLGTCGAPLMALSRPGRPAPSVPWCAPHRGRPSGGWRTRLRVHPQYVVGTCRAEPWLMREVPGALAKMGAARARGPVPAHALEALGAASPVLARVADEPLPGDGVRIGEVRGAF